MSMIMSANMLTARLKASPTLVYQGQEIKVNPALSFRHEMGVRAQLNLGIKDGSGKTIALLPLELSREDVNRAGNDSSFEAQRGDLLDINPTRVIPRGETQVEDVPLEVDASTAVVESLFFSNEIPKSQGVSPGRPSDLGGMTHPRDIPDCVVPGVGRGTTIHVGRNVVWPTLPLDLQPFIRSLEQGFPVDSMYSFIDAMQTRAYYMFRDMRSGGNMHPGIVNMLSQTVTVQGLDQIKKVPILEGLFSPPHSLIEGAELVFYTNSEGQMILADIVIFLQLIKEAGANPVLYPFSLGLLGMGGYNFSHGTLLSRSEDQDVNETILVSDLPDQNLGESFPGNNLVVLSLRGTKMSAQRLAHILNARPGVGVVIKKHEDAAVEFGDQLAEFVSDASEIITPL